MTSMLNILLVEDSEADAKLLIRFLKKENVDCSYKRVWDKGSFITALEENNYDLIIADQKLPQFSGMEAFQIAKKKYNNAIPFILITGVVSERVLTQYSKEGIDDYILKDNLLRLPVAIENVLSKKRIEQLHCQLEIAYQDIQHSIDYAKIIQEAILPDRSLLYEHFPGSFIYFKPKDILSGDFYWFKKVKNIFYLAVADCTGHGIPGAMLSMVGFNMLYESVPEKAVTQPSDILFKMNKQFRKIARNGTSLINDSIDIAFCTIDLNKHILMYAGAKRPLFIERGKDLMEYKGDRISIGGLGSEKQFTNHSISIQKGDRIFLFSDGFLDQFSEDTDKKLNVKRLRKLIVQSADLGYEDQKKFIIDFFEDWKGKKEQVDDVLLMCIQIP